MKHALLALLSTIPLIIFTYLAGWHEGYHDLAINLRTGLFSVEAHGPFVGMCAAVDTDVLACAVDKRGNIDGEMPLSLAHTVYRDSDSYYQGVKTIYRDGNIAVKIVPDGKGCR